MKFSVFHSDYFKEFVCVTIKDLCGYTEFTILNRQPNLSEMSLTIAELAFTGFTFGSFTRRWKFLLF